MLTKTLAIVALAIPHHAATIHHHEHHTKGCSTHACDVRVGHKWAKEHPPPVRWEVTGASIYGGNCGPGEVKGYRGAYLPDHPFSFAELGMGNNLGGLPDHARIVIRSPETHRQHVVEKNDIGGGGGDVDGHVRSIDLYGPAAEYIANASCTWTGVVEWHRV